jgi:flagellar biosynthesis GTPase FlhF
MNATDNTKTYRGRTLEEVLPKIKAELGPDAEIVRQRSGLTGGVGGFFQRATVEVEARPAKEAAPKRRRFDAYDDSPAMPEPYEAEPEPEAFVPDEVAQTPAADGLSAPGIQEILRQAAPFADALSSASQELEPRPEPVAPATQPAPAPARERPATADALETTLRDQGLDAARARALDRVHRARRRRQDPLHRPARRRLRERLRSAGGRHRPARARRRR